MEISDIARICHDANKSVCELNGDFSQLSWTDATDWQKNSAIIGVKAVRDNPSISPSQLHQSWCDTKTADGWVYGETKDPEAKTHPCLVSYAQLPEFQRVKDQVFQAIARALLFKV